MLKSTDVRSLGCLAVLSVVAAPWLCATASAQALPRESLDLERFKPAVTDDGFVITEGTAVRSALPADPVHIGLVLNGSMNPLLLVGSDGLENRLVSRRFGIDVLGSITVIDSVAVGVELPIFVGQAGELDPNAAGIGDIRIVPKWRIVDDRRAPLGLALLAEVRLPTHGDDEFSGGARSPVFAPKIAVDHRFPLGLRLGANTGVLLRQSTVFENVEAASELTYSAGAALHLGGYDGLVAVGADVHGGAGLAALDFEEFPLEGQLYGSIRPRPNVEILTGPAMGLVPGYGTPTFRYFLGFRWAPTESDRDFDGITDAEDDCPDEREVRNNIDDLDGCPDGEQRYPATIVTVIPDGSELDKVPATIVLPDGETATARTGNTTDLPAGRYPVTIEVAGYKPAKATLVVKPGGDSRVVVELVPLPANGLVRVEIVGPDGGPVKKSQARVDDDKASPGDVPGTVEVEVLPGEHVLWVRAKGHVPQRIEIVVKPGGEVTKKVTLNPVEIEITDDRLEFSGSVYFATGSAQLLGESHDLLDEVVLVLQDSKAIKLLRVEGHTDSRGSAEMNQTLSDARASSVMAYLVKSGIDEGRLEAQGFGETQPISEIHDENRRVEFVILRGGF